MLGAIRSTISKKKIRYIQDGYNLDLTYITSDIIAMGFPASNVESLYRNNVSDVSSFLLSKHKTNYKIYHLCSEKYLNETKFEGQMKKYPFDDHKPPNFLTMLLMTKDAYDFKLMNKENTIVINCKAGKGRTGVMVCACLIAFGMAPNAINALKEYGERRTYNGKGVTISSQRRYVLYFGHLINTIPRSPNENNSGRAYYRPLKINLVKVEFIHYQESINQFSPHPTLSLEITNHEAKLSKDGLDLVKNQPKLYSISQTKSEERDTTVFSCPQPLSLSGDVQVKCTNKKKLFEFWFNTFFVLHNCPSYVFAKSATKQKKSLQTDIDLGSNTPSFDYNPATSSDNTDNNNEPSTTTGLKRGQMSIRNILSLSRHSSQANPRSDENGQHVGNSKLIKVKHEELQGPRNFSFGGYDQKKISIPQPIKVNNHSDHTSNSTRVDTCTCMQKSDFSSENGIKNAKISTIEFQIERIKTDEDLLAPRVFSVAGHLPESHSHELVLTSLELDNFDTHTFPSNMLVKLTFDCNHAECLNPKENSACSEEPGHFQEDIMNTEAS